MRLLRSPIVQDGVKQGPSADLRVTIGAGVDPGYCGSRGVSSATWMTMPPMVLAIRL
jgi:hypothetical protein